MAPDGEQPQNIATAITDVSERVSLLVREEIELAKAEITQKVTRLIKGAVVGMAAGIFVVTALLFFLHGLSWLAWFELFGGTNEFYWGFIIVGGALLLLGALAGYTAARAFRSSTPPTPAMAIDEAKKIRETVTSSDGGR
ncbi:MAG TPA: phage holin family protein [Solirubrobacteraceae bacterium]|nr:phage holin family protein [Solirubrobacteraceae bacterium]